MPGERVEDAAPGEELGGLALWGPAGRWLFLNWPRGSWQYDLICFLIIMLLFSLPKS